jgi:hypothetical protein
MDYSHREPANSVTIVFALLYQFDFVTFRRVNEREHGSGGARRRTVGIFQAVFGKVLAEFFEVVHLERQMREVGLHLYRAAGRETANFNLLVAGRRLEKNELRTTRRFVPLDFFEAEHVAIKLYRAFQIVHAIARVQQFCDFVHVRKFSEIFNRRKQRKRRC